MTLIIDRAITLIMIFLNQLLAVYKTKAEIARVLGISKQAVQKWPKDGAIPVYQELRLRHEINPEAFSEPDRKPEIPNETE